MLFNETGWFPSGATTLGGFRRWRRSLGEDAPRVDFIDGDLWLDMSPQSHRSHLPVTSAINATLWTLSRDTSLGRYTADGGWITQDHAGLSTRPDGFFALWETLRAGLLVAVEDSEIELKGRPDMVLEVVSTTSVRKDTRVLRDNYAQAGVPEFWLVDARGDEPAFTLLVLKDRAYAAVDPDTDGFSASPVWGRSFRFRRVVHPLGTPDYRLDVREDA